jgi:hypothetical protein
MKRIAIAVLLLMSSVIAAAQCSTGSPGTTCAGPLTIQPSASNTTQTAIILVDLGLPLVPPAGKQYILSIASGVLQESDNGGAYHSLVGPQGPPGSAGSAGSQGVTGQAGPPGVQGNPGIQGIQGPQGQAGQPGQTGQPGQGLVVGSVLTLNLVCPKGKGTVTAGFTSKDCTATITAIH